MAITMTRPNFESFADMSLFFIEYRDTLERLAVGGELVVSRFHDKAELRDFAGEARKLGNGSKNYQHTINEKELVYITRRTA